MTDPRSAAAGGGPTLSFGFNLAKVPGAGEDSDPILREGPDLGLAGVFDGMGGAGGTIYETADGPRSGAYLASRIARDVVEAHLLATLAPERPLADEETARTLHDLLEAALQDAVAGLNAPTSRLRSRLLRALPTTMALGALQRTERDGPGWVCHVFWSGDSRVYALTPDGMHQLSSDDLRDDGDAMANLRGDSVISNAISADTEFRINHRRALLQTPFVLLCATDGCFGYLRSPMHFEEIVLRTLASATNEDDWSATLQNEIAAVTGDDASMATIAVGADLTELQQLFAARRAEVTEQYTAPMDDLVDEVARAEQALAELQRRRAADTTARWARYRDGYERFLRQGSEPEPDAVEAPERTLWNPPKTIATGAADGGPARAEAPTDETPRAGSIEADQAAAR